MAHWNIAVLSNARYREDLTFEDRTDLQRIILGVNAIASDTALDESLQYLSADTAAAATLSAGIMDLTFAIWRVLGDECLGNPDMNVWIPVALNVNETMVEDAVEGESTPVMRLFAALVTAARQNKEIPQELSIADGERDVVVPAAIAFAGAALQFIAARHPHAPKVKPGLKKMPPKVNALAVDLLGQIDAALAS